MLGTAPKTSGTRAWMWASAAVMLSLCGSLSLSTLNSTAMNSIVKCRSAKSLRCVSFCNVNEAQCKSVHVGDEDVGVGIVQCSAVVSIFCVRWVFYI